MVVASARMMMSISVTIRGVVDILQLSLSVGESEAKNIKKLYYVTIYVSVVCPEFSMFIILANLF